MAEARIRIAAWQGIELAKLFSIFMEVRPLYSLFELGFCWLPIGVTRKTTLEPHFMPAVLYCIRCAKGGELARFFTFC